MNDSAVRVHRFMPYTEAEGPGARAAIWVQGCPIACKGCFNPETWSRAGGAMWELDELFRQIELEVPRIEGVTFVGGEPFADSVGALAQLGAMCQGAGLSVVTFSGYPYARLRRDERPAVAALLDATDLLLAGPYVESLQDFSRPWVGSSNQEFIFLTDRYRELKDDLTNATNRLEFSVNDRGAVHLNGQENPAMIARLQNELRRLGLDLQPSRESTESETAL